MIQKRKRLFIDKKTGAKERLNIVKFAVENGCSALVFSLDDRYFKSRNRNRKYIKLAKQHSLSIEAGGCNFSLLLPPRLFLFNRDLFRMVEGKRKADHHFCPTNPRTTAIVAENARALFTRAMREMTVPRVFHLLPEKGYENSWCACPACRAFSPAEQNLIVVNTAAGALEKLDPDALILYHDFGTEPEAEGIAPRKNTFCQRQSD
jgi:hypothetical protein